MPTVLLPSSAAAFAPRSSPNVVLNSRIEPWLTAALKRVNRVKRPLNNVAQHTRCLTETLSSANAIWNLCSMMLPKAPESDLRKDENPLVEAIFNYQMIHIEAYVVHVDMVSQNEVAFKLTPETIEALVEHHKEVYSIDAAANTWDWAEKDNQLKKLQEEFIQAANKFVYRTSAQALEGLEEDGAGELLGGRSEDAKSAIFALFVPLLPPPPRVVDVLRSTPLLPSSTGPETWWHDSMQQPVSMDSWKVLPSSPAPVTTADANSSMWTGLNGMSDMQMVSTAPTTSAYSQAYTTSPYNTLQYYSAAATSAALAALPLPSMLVQPCSTAANMTGFGWGDRYQDLALPYGTTM
ncbi:uncharacterized protein ANIA_04088 [Aspergillus nidulans FGSC A4]|uniref:Uncharacterized protein n=1 Tax=Emericella nidulans (strain FGSC A4 / ATCC 38163 / CBS 112.46 / NRRL 194 / M139) TaxID=227321 RepID=C8V5C0_EMENI|nr:hypothetical protein [Aspergillus nidulans FGSC A4]CBF74730.1 TPA: hypothetical protein ANIA_04088 [Aspergillus nidulans FGSC A4]